MHTYCEMDTYCERCTHKHRRLFWNENCPNVFTFQPGQVTSWLADALDEARLNLPRGEVKYVYNEEGSSVALSPRAKARVVYDLTQMLAFCHESDEPESVDAIKAALAVLR